EHPYANPLDRLGQRLPLGDDFPRETPKPWYEKGITPQDFPWVDLDTSLQWPAFQRVVETLQQRGNRVFVLVGPFNEHLLTPDSLDRYEAVKGAIVAWLEEKQIPHLVPPPRARDQYGDSSHPLAAGYATLARDLHEALQSP